MSRESIGHLKGRRPGVFDEWMRLLRGSAELCSLAEPPSINDPGRIRTCDLRIRNPLLYPTELRGRHGAGCLSCFDKATG